MGYYLAPVPDAPDHFYAIPKDIFNENMNYLPHGIFCLDRENERIIYGDVVKRMENGDLLCKVPDPEDVE